MSLIPLLLDDLSRLQSRPLFDQHFGSGLFHDDLFHPYLMPVPSRSGYVRPWRHQPHRRSGMSDIQNTKDCFKVNLDVQQFKPEEINVKMIDNFVVVEGKHEERQDEHGYITRQFQRRYMLPEDVDPEAVVSKLSSDGILSIEAPKKALPAPSNKERPIPITHTNAPAVTAHPQTNGETTEKMDQ